MSLHVGPGKGPGHLNRSPGVLGGSAPTPGSALTTLTGPAPAVRFNPGFSTMTPSRTAGTSITAMSDLMSLANAANGTTSPASTAPVLMQDALGRWFLRFEGASWMGIATALSINPQTCASFFIGRMHRAGGGASINNRIWGIGNTDAGTQAFNTLDACMQANGASNAAPSLEAFTVSSNADANKANLICGSQLQLIGMASRLTANGAIRFYLNEQVGSGVQGPTSGTGTGAELGRYPRTPGSVNWGCFDLYELAIWNTSITNAQADAIQAAYLANWQFAALTNQAIVEGDSITQGIAPITSGKSLAMRLSDPGGALSFPPSWRVINMGHQGDVVSQATARRDATNGMYGMILPGRNVVALHIGTNDLSASATPATIYSGITAMWNTATTGYLQRGWEGVQVLNTARGLSQGANLITLRGMLADPQFLVDTGTNTGGAFQGKIRTANLPATTIGGATICATTTDAANTTYYVSDQIHPTQALLDALATGAGADSAANSYAVRMLAAA